VLLPACLETFWPFPLTMYLRDVGVSNYRLVLAVVLLLVWWFVYDLFWWGSGRPEEERGIIWANLEQKWRKTFWMKLHRWVFCFYLSYGEPKVKRKWSLSKMMYYLPFYFMKHLHLQQFCSHPVIWGWRVAY